MDIKELITLAQGGGSVALLICVYFIFRAAERLARIEKTLELMYTAWLRKYHDEYESSQSTNHQKGFTFGESRSRF